MRTEKEVIQRFFQARYRHIQKRLRRRPQSPSLCRYNRVFRSTSGKQVGCCRYREISGDDDWSVALCDAEMPEGVAQAANCPVFEYRVTKQEAADFVDHILLHGKTGEIAYHFPDLNALLWVLGEEAKESVLSRIREKGGGGREVDEESKELLTRLPPEAPMKEPPQRVKRGGE